MKCDICKSLLSKEITEDKILFTSNILSFGHSEKACMKIDDNIFFVTEKSKVCLDCVVKGLIRITNK